MSENSQKKKCSMCGKVFDMWDEQENFCFDRHIGYGSEFDLMHIKFNLCCECFDKVFRMIKPMFKEIYMRDYTEDCLNLVDKKKERNKMKIYFNIEASGLYVGEQGHKNARILSINAIKTDGDMIIDKFATFVACGEYLPKCVREITGISNDLLKGAPRTNKVLKLFKEFVGDCTLISYNIAFDMSFLNFYGNKYGIKFDNPQIDLLPLAKEILAGRLKNFSIVNVAKEFGISTDTNDIELIYEIGKRCFG